MILLTTAEENHTVLYDIAKTLYIRIIKSRYNSLHIGGNKNKIAAQCDGKGPPEGCAGAGHRRERGSERM